MVYLATIQSGSLCKKDSSNMKPNPSFSGQGFLDLCFSHYGEIHWLSLEGEFFCTVLQCLNPISAKFPETLHNVDLSLSLVCMLELKRLFETSLFWGWAILSYYPARPNFHNEWIRSNKMSLYSFPSGEKNPSREWHRSINLWVMSPAPLCCQRCPSWDLNPRSLAEEATGTLF